MIKPQDIVILAKILAHMIKKKWATPPLSQHEVAFELCLSPSQINAALKRLYSAGLVGLMATTHLTVGSPDPSASHPKPLPIIQACEEFFIHALKYVFPAKLGEISRGIATSYAGPSLKTQIVAGSDPIPVWPYGEGEARGVALKPLYHNVPESIAKHPDPLFYDLLTLLDAIRSGRARERQIAGQKLSEILKSNKNPNSTQ